MQLALWMLCAFVPDAGRLGADDWLEREAETRRCQNPISAALLPARSDDAEVDLRVKTIRTDQLKWANPLYVERMVLRDDFDRWIVNYLVTGRTMITRTKWFFTDHIIGKPNNCARLFRRYPLAPGDVSCWMMRPELPADFEYYNRWLDHHGIALNPHDKDK